MNENQIKDVQETTPPTIEELQKQIAGLTDQVTQMNNINVALREAIVKQAVKL